MVFDNPLADPGFLELSIISFALYPTYPYLPGTAAPVLEGCWLSLFWILLSLKLPVPLPYLLGVSFDPF